MRWQTIRLLALAALAGACAPRLAPAPTPAAPPPAAPAVQAPAPVVALPEPSRPGQTPLSLEREPEFDIGLAVDLDSVRLDPSSAVVLRWRGPGGVAESATTAAPLGIRASGSQFLVTPLDRARAVPLAVLEASDTLWVGESENPRSDGTMGWNGKRWRGRFKVFLSPRGKLTVATRVPLETYLLGVVPAEIGALSDSLLEAGRAQAIAARSYSLFYRGRRAAEGFDLYASVEDQVFGPVESERPLATRCVTSTRAEVALSDGQPIRANYSSTCGGISAEAWEAWPTEPRDYLVSRRDRGVGEGDHCGRSSHYRWREEWSPSEFAANLARFGAEQGIPLPPKGVGEVLDVRVSSRSRSGRVWRLTVTTSTGVIVVPAHHLRQVLRRGGNPSAILRSTLIKIDVRRDRLGRATAVVASGAGNGHGVGLCQTGALAMARGGAAGETIIEQYYAGVRIRPVY